VLVRAAFPLAPTTDSHLNIGTKEITRESNIRSQWLAGTESPQSSAVSRIVPADLLRGDVLYARESSNTLSLLILCLVFAVSTFGCSPTTASVGIRNQNPNPAKPSRMASAPTLIPAPNALAAIAVGEPSSVWALDPEGNVFKFDATKGAFKSFPARLSSISVGFDGSTWGLDSGEHVYEFGANKFTPVPGKLSAIAVGNRNAVWGLNNAGQVYRFDSHLGSFRSVPGDLRQLSVGFDGAVWGLNTEGVAYRLSGGRFVSIGGNLVRIAALNAGNAWGLNSLNSVYRFTQPRGFENMAGNLVSISVGRDGTVWGLNSKDAIFYFDGRKFVPYPGRLTQISAGHNVVFGINAVGVAYKLGTPI
jgi:hypothetical protein